MSQEDDVQSRGEVARYDVDAVEAIAMLQPGHLENQNLNPLEALLGAGAGFPPLLDIPPDADDEAMVELAIALSLQDELGGDLQQGQQALHNLQVKYFFFTKIERVTIFFCISY